MEQMEVKSSNGLGGKEMKDWRIKHINCRDCAEFQDNIAPTEMCKTCKCYNCKSDRSRCLKGRYCSRDGVEFNEYHGR